MKKIFLMAAIASISMGAMAFGKMEKNEKKEMRTEKMKAHVCNASCTKDKCNIMHGEKGHTCTDACKKKM